MTKLPKQLWTEVSVDFCGPFSSGDYIMVVIDDYSRYPEVEILKSLSANSVITKLDKIFSTFGIPEVVKKTMDRNFKDTSFMNFPTSWDSNTEKSLHYGQKLTVKLNDS